MKKLITPKYFFYTFCITTLVWISLFIYRILTWKLVFPKNIQNFNDDLKHSLFIGARFDLRVALWIIVPIFLLTLVSHKQYFISKKWKKFNLIYFITVFILVNLFYTIDIGNYLYLNERITASFLTFFKNPLISGQMMWENYPVLWIVFGLVIITYIQVLLIKKIYHYFENKEYRGTKRSKIFYAVVGVLLIFTGIFGKLGQFPLRWSEAFFQKNNDISQLTLNPILNFINSFNFSEIKEDKKETEKYFPVIAGYLGIKSNKKLQFERTYEPLNDSIPDAKNVVVMMMESLGAQPLGIFNNPLKGTPFIDSLAQNSWFFDHFYVPRFGTARTVYASLTGIPDVFEGDVKASYNPSAVDQRIIFDQLKVDKKLYFIGGDANWANIRALFTNNISEIDIFENGKYSEGSRADVWGLDDYDLFKNSTQELGKLHQQKKSFVAYIQTAAYHGPYTVPDKRGTFKPLTENEIDVNKVLQAGFISLEQFNSLRYFDYNLKKFFEFAKKEGFYEDTVFLMFGDHNGHVNPYHHMQKPEYETKFGQYHVPLIIHGKDLPKKRDQRITSLLDVFPTIADLMNQKYTNYTLGRSILRRKSQDKEFAFVFQEFNGKDLPCTIWKDNFMYSEKKGEKINPLFSYEKNKYDKEDNSKSIEFKKSVDSITKAIYQSTLYLYFNNKK